MRLIDADALIKDIDGDLLDGIAEARAIEKIENAPTIGGWISVKDRLPKSMANKVLVWLEHEDLVGYIGFGHYEKYKGQEIWYDLEHNEAFLIRGYVVTHWMPLPEPPEEDATSGNH